MLSDFINLIKTIIEMNEFYNFLSTSALKIYFLNINTYIVINTKEYFTHLISSFTNWKSLSDNLIDIVAVGSDTTTTLPTLP